MVRARRPFSYLLRDQGLGSPSSSLFRRPLRPRPDGPGGRRVPVVVRRPAKRRDGGARATVDHGRGDIV